MPALIDSIRIQCIIMEPAGRACIAGLFNEDNTSLLLIRVTLRNLILLIVAVLTATSVAADQNSAAAEQPVVTYPAKFFDRYRPNTAFDMVKQLPGFQLDDGDDRRGFGGSAGNLLINDRYLSAKQDKPSLMLLRIPADQVERIELIRGQVRDINLQGAAIVANLVLVQNAPAAIRWELGVRKNFIFSPLAPNGAISISDTWRDVEYNLVLMHGVRPMVILGYAISSMAAAR